MPTTYAQRSTAKAESTQRTQTNRTRATDKTPSSLHPASLNLLHLQHTLGNRAVSRFLQAKLTLSHPDDPYEREADRVADTVMRMPEPLRSDEEKIVQT